MHLPRHGNVPTLVNTTYLPNNMCDSKREGRILIDVTYNVTCFLEMLSNVKGM